MVLPYQSEDYGGAGGGGAENISELLDVDITNLANGEILKYNTSNGKWENGVAGGLEGQNLYNNFVLKYDTGVNKVVNTSLLEEYTASSSKISFYPTDGLLSVFAGKIEAQYQGGQKKIRISTDAASVDKGITIDNDGRVGIGLSNPTEDLELAGNIQLDTGGVQGRVIFYDKQNDHEHAEVDGLGEGTNGGSLAFYTKVDGGSVTEKLRINQVGAIGIKGANYGTSGQVLTSNGSGSAVSWETLAGTTYTAGTGVNISGANVISIGQSVANTDSPIFNSLTIGNYGTNTGILNIQDLTNIGTDTIAQIKGIKEGTNGGELQLFTKIDGGSLTQKVTINGDGAIGLGATPTYGTSGQVLTSQGSGVAPIWSSPSVSAVYFRAGNNRSVAVDLNPNSSFNKLIYDIVNFNSSSMYNTSTGVFTVPSSGVYKVCIQVLVEHNPQFYTGELRLQNTTTGTTLSQTMARNENGGSGEEYMYQLSTLISVSANDQIEVQFRSLNNPNQIKWRPDLTGNDGTGTSEFCVFKL